MKLRLLWSRKNEKKAPSERLFLSDSRERPGTPISAQSLYLCFHDVWPRPKKWHPHFGRHVYACSFLLNALEAEAKERKRTLREMGADWINSRGLWHLNTLRMQLGHLSESTTDLYLRWLVTAEGVADVTSDWHQFLSGESGHEDSP